MGEERQERTESIPPETIAGIRTAIDGLTEHEARELLKDLENLQHRCKERIIHARIIQAKKNVASAMTGGGGGTSVSVEDGEKDDGEEEAEAEEEEEEEEGLEGTSGNELAKLKVNRNRS